MKIVEEITTAIDKKKCTLGVFIDLKKAFDTINHSILISELYIYMESEESYWTGSPAI